MVNRSGQKGTKGESDRVRYMQGRGWKYATRIPKKGARDCGDMILDQAVPVMIESKETKAFTPSTFIAEMNAQIEHSAAEFGFVIAKKRGTTDVGQYYALTTVAQIMALIERVWQPSKLHLVDRQGSLCGVYDEYGQCDMYWGHADEGLPHVDSTNPQAFAQPRQLLESTSKQVVGSSRKPKTFTRR